MSLFDGFSEKQQRHRHISQLEHVYGNQNRRYNNQRERHGEHEPHYLHSRDRDPLSKIRSFVQKLVLNKTLLVLVSLVLVVALGLFVAALAFILPLVPKLLAYLYIDGLKTVLGQGMYILEKVVAIGAKWQFNVL